MAMTETEWVANGCPDNVAVVCDECGHGLNHHEDGQPCDAAFTPRGVSGQMMYACGCTKGM